MNVRRWVSSALLLSLFSLGCGSAQPEPERAPTTVEVAAPADRPEPPLQRDPMVSQRERAHPLIGACNREPTAADLSEAKQQFRMGIELFTAEELSAAATAFSRAYTLTCKVAVLYNLGAVLERLDDSAGAIAAFERYLEHEPDGERTAELRERIERLRAQRQRAFGSD